MCHAMTPDEPTDAQLAAWAAEELWLASMIAELDIIVAQLHLAGGCALDDLD